MVWYEPFNQKQNHARMRASLTDANLTIDRINHRNSLCDVTNSSLKSHFRAYCGVVLGGCGH